MFGFIGNILALSPPTSIPVSVPFTQGGYTYTDYLLATQSLIPNSLVTDCSEYRVRYYVSGSNRPYFGLAYPNKLFFDWGGYANHPVIQYIAVRSGNNCVFTTPYAPSTNANTGVFNYTAYPISSVVFLASRDILYGGNHDFGSLYCNLGNMINGGVVFEEKTGPSSAYQLDVSVEPIGSGNVTVNSATCPDDYPCQLPVNVGTQASLQATPNDNYVFDHWEWTCDCSGTTNSTDNPLALTPNGDWGVKGVFRPILQFPLHDYTPYTAPVSSVFDHSGNAQYEDTDHLVTAFNGESSEFQTSYTGTTCYRKNDNSAFGTGFNYDGIASAGNCYLCYNGHPGYDYAVATGTNVYSAAAGTIIVAGFDSCLGNNVTINHGGGYRTRYFHLNSIDTVNVQLNQPIQRNITIGESGNTGSCSDGEHLHFQVEKLEGTSWIPIDPYGWTSTETDPYTRATNITLWE